MRLEWSLELTSSYHFSYMKMLRWSLAYSAMVFNDFYLNWSSWFTIRSWLVPVVRDLFLRRLLDFLFLCFFFLFLLRCSSLLLQLDEEELHEEVKLILLLFPRKILSEEIDFFLLCLRSSELFSERSTLSPYFNLNLRKKLLQRFSQIREFRPLHMWMTKEGGEA